MVGVIVSIVTTMAVLERRSGPTRVCWCNAIGHEDHRQFDTFADAKVFADRLYRDQPSIMDISAAPERGPIYRPEDEM
jgi:hypothetical protein